MIQNGIVKDLKSVNEFPTRDGLGKGLVKLGSTNKNVIALCCDLAKSTRLDWFRDKFPERFIEVGVAEQNMMSMAAGMALEGFVPFVSSYSVFSPGRNWDQLRVSVCYSNANVKVVASHAGVTVGADGATHQALEDIAIARVLPGMVVVVPADSLEAEKATLAIAEHNGPCMIRLTREKVPVVTSESTPFEIGKAYTAREGSDVVIFSCGPELYHALVAAENLEKKKISAMIVHIHTVKPIDKEAIISAAKKCKAVVTCEEHQKMAGFGSAVAEVLVEEYPVPMKFVGVNDSFSESGKPVELLDKYQLSAPYIEQACEDVLKRK